ncbi:MAG TPA: HEAT repeat domain-containing protein, partial [Candidatus Ozemobacteraceae bacterium]|nr:HEAT repeat domain-containing protein [Candidatus Ozemobacteraceae bacterium]
KIRQQNDEEGRVAGPRESIDLSLESEEYEERLKAVMSIAATDKAEYREKLVVMLKTEKNDFVKATLISCLKKFLSKEQASLLSPFLNDPDNRVRSNTIEAFEFLKAEKAIPLLFPALEDPDNRIRASAAKALQSFGEEKVFATLRKMLKSHEDWMKGSAIYALSHIQAGEAIQMLIDAARDANSDIRIKALVALANYHDQTSYGFLKHIATTGEEPFRGTAVRALRLLEEKHGSAPPTTTLVSQAAAEQSTAPSSGEGAAKDAHASGGKTGEAASAGGDLAGTVSRFFRKGKDEAVGLSQKAAINFAVTDIQKEVSELLKESGRVVFEMYQSGDLKIPELLTIGHEILRMNFLIQKYTDEAKPQSGQGSGFFAQLKSLFSKKTEANPRAAQAERFTQKREELFQKLGESSFQKFRVREFCPTALEGYFQTYMRLEERLQNERNRLSG